MNDKSNFEQQLSALVPASVQTDASTMMYRCGFAAGQASRSTSDTTTRRQWLQLAMAACVTAILVGPVSYRLGHSKFKDPHRGVVVAEHESHQAAPSNESVVTAESVPIAPSDPPEPPKDQPRKRNVATKSGPSIFASWLIGVPSPFEPSSDASASNAVVLTSRPPSADMMAWLEQSPAAITSPPNPANPAQDATKLESLKIRHEDSGPYHLPSLPSRKSLHTWETWFQS
ncbi:hypothetical protein [Novipirellula sp.]|uniref:hypothetical protein n=1 Tax=Novipirellula sp. TaxID=2795430 RepID=UPI0035633EB8